MQVRVWLPRALLALPPGAGALVCGELQVASRHALALYFTRFMPRGEELSGGASVYGCYGRARLPVRFASNSIEIDRTAATGRLRVARLTLGCRRVDIEGSDIIIVFYDHETMQQCESWPANDNDMFSKLRDCVLRDADKAPRRDEYNENMLVKVHSSLWAKNSVFVVHLGEFVVILQWMFTKIRRERHISISTGNMLTALMTDIIIGYLVLNFVSICSDSFSDTLMDYVEVVVNYLRSLLKWLMGAPAGLKLNKAFNNMLGKFFLYHIELWWMFLELMKGGVNVILQIYYCFGYLGITFQAAIISDMISFVSFHAYCIYVYVARLFNIQASGLAALLRLFVGRKKNPLRGGVDSCEYSNQELFVGTVAFTILLFLLPTTAMYYFVFTLFRLISLAIQGVLARLCYSIKTLPLYVTFLWLIGSSRIAGNIHMEVLKEQGDAMPLVLEVKFTARPLSVLIKTYSPPPVKALESVQWTEILYKILKGNLIGSL